MSFSSVSAGRYDFPAAEWSSISDEAKDLIRRLLVKDARQRLSAAAVLTHPWLSRLDQGHRPLVTPQIIRRNQSARELSSFAESAMSANRVILQHFSICRGKEDFRPEDGSTEGWTGPGMRLSPPSESLLVQRRQRLGGGQSQSTVCGGASQPPTVATVQSMLAKLVTPLSG